MMVPMMDGELRRACSFAENQSCIQDCAKANPVEVARRIFAAGGRWIDRKSVV